MIAAGAPITLREFIVAIRPQWDTISAGMPRPTGVADLSEGQPRGGPAFGASVLTDRQAILTGVGVASRALQRLLPAAGSTSRPISSTLLGGGAPELFDIEVSRLIVGERRDGQVGHVGIHPGPPPRWN